MVEARSVNVKNTRHIRISDPEGFDLVSNLVESRHIRSSSVARKRRRKCEFITENNIKERTYPLLFRRQIRGVLNEPLCARIKGVNREVSEKKADL